ncbi:MAG: restriction endonuclease subunit S [Ottowia sp.]|nr:restriction endonuclease subunit S [Ottowia sp.]
MSSSSPAATLNDACEFIVDCLHATAPTQEDGFPLIRTPNIGKGRLDLNGVYRVSEETYETWTRRAIPEPDDLILAREAPAGNVAIIKNGECVCLGQRTVHLRPDKTKVDPDFLCYFLLAPLQQGRLLAGETGATAKHVNMRDIRKLPLDGLPSLSAQKTAGSMLAAYDDLIENNSRRMALLEEAARQLYREWFVRLRFPGHEHTRIIDGVPEGWERKTAHNVLEILSGGTPKTTVADYWEGDIPFYTPKDAVDGVWVTDAERSITELGLANCNSKLYPRETVFISARGTVGKLNMAQRPMAMSQSCYALVGKDGVGQPFVFFAMQAAVEALKQQAVGAVFDAIIVETFKRIHLLIPDSRLLRLFDESFRLVLQQVENLTIQNHRLRTARDLLLPRLMSGEITV